jgi:hypothetical protein
MADDQVRVWPDGPHWTPPDDIVEVLRSLADGYPEDVFPTPPEGQRCTDAGAAYVLRRVAVPWFTAAADSIEALRSALAEACDAFVECTGGYAQELAGPDLLRWRALANPLFESAAAVTPTGDDDV